VTASEYTRAAVEHWMELLAGEYGASTIEALLDATDRYHLVKDTTPLSTALRPTFIEHSRVSAIDSVGTVVATAIRTATDRALRDRNFRLGLGFLPYMDQMAELDGPSSRGAIHARLDGVFDRTGTHRFIELNTLPGGVTEGVEVGKALERAPIARVFARRFPFAIDDTRDRLVDALIDEVRAQGRSLPVRLNFGSGTPASILARSPWIGYASARGCKITFTALAELEVREDAVYADGERVDIVHLPVDQLLRPGNPLSPLLDAIRRGVVRTLSGLSSSLFSSNKIMFEALSDPAHASMFDHATQRALQAHIPWTRHVRARRTTFEGRDIDLLPFLAANRERFVLKPAGSFAGDGVVLGPRCPPEIWERALKAAAKRPHVVQQYLEGTDEPFPMLVNGGIVHERCTADYNPFVSNGTTAAGACVRLWGSANHTPSWASVAGIFILAPPRDHSSLR
jgi:hypothetical protein